MGSAALAGSGIARQEARSLRQWRPWHADCLGVLLRELVDGSSVEGPACVAGATDSGKRATKEGGGLYSREWRAAGPGGIPEAGREPLGSRDAGVGRSSTGSGRGLLAGLQIGTPGSAFEPFKPEFLERSFLSARCRCLPNHKEAGFFFPLLHFCGCLQPLCSANLLPSPPLASPPPFTPHGDWLAGVTCLCPCDLLTAAVSVPA